ncbi:MAG: hypothetical protein NT131_06565 [Methanomassiliicoccales archaeon]|nr:hypothetical protein [Methanomassiliicoccales archaeon]
MSHFLALHTWKKENFKVVGRKIVEALPNLPKGSAIVYSFTDARQTGAWCIYETEKPEEVKQFLDKRVPEMTTEMIPVLQFFPPGMDLYTLVHILAS